MAKPSSKKKASKKSVPKRVLVKSSKSRAFKPRPVKPYQEPKVSTSVAEGSEIYGSSKVETPFEGNIRAGKNTYVYDAHTYHTKVPPEGIAKLIEYYTRPGETVLDPFCGSGMTGVAAGELGRRVVISDLSPAATFIARNLNTPCDPATYWKAVSQIAEEARELEEHLYGTPCRACGTMNTMLYTVWSFGVSCPRCEGEFILWDVARDEKPRVRDSKLLSEFDCPNCKAHLVKKRLKRTVRYPVQVGYKCCAGGLKEMTSSPSQYDLAKLEAIERDGIPADLWYPTSAFPEGVNTRQPILAGIRSIDQAYTKRALYAMAWLWQRAGEWPDPDIADKLRFTVTSLYQRVTHFSEFRFWGGSSNTANFNVPAISNEQNVFRTFLRKAKTIKLYFEAAPKLRRDVDVRTASACDLSHVPNGSADYVFTDPPFGSNINYSEMNFLWESWLQQRTDIRDEAIVNKVQGKGLRDYERLLAKAFSECRRVLKDNGWMTVIFHNSSGEVWEALRKAVHNAGFSICGTQTFDKAHGTFKQFVSDNAVGYDLVLHCQKSEVLAINPRQRQKSITNLKKFVRDRMADTPDAYRVHYLHVKRNDEWDFRKLHAEWLAQNLRDGEELVGFEEFRKLASTEFESLPQGLTQTKIF